MCEATVLPHWVHLLSCGATQRWDALRVRSRIFEVLRFGTPIRAVQVSRESRKGNRVQPLAATTPAYPARSNPASALSPISRQLRCAPAGSAARGKSARRRMARETMRSAWIMPDLAADASDISDLDRFVQSIFPDECRVGLGRVPAVGKAIDPTRVLHEKPCLDAARRTGDAVGQLEIEMFDPHRAIWERPVAVRIEPDELAEAGHREPAPLQRVVRPEGRVDLEGDDARLRLQRGEI